MTVWGYVIGIGTSALTLYIAVKYPIDYIWVPVVLFFCIVIAYLHIKYGRQIARYQLGLRESLTPAFVILIVLNLGGGTSLLLIPVLVYGLVLSRSLST